MPPDTTHDAPPTPQLRQMLSSLRTTSIELPALVAMLEQVTDQLPLADAPRPASEWEAILGELRGPVQAQANLQVELLRTSFIQLLSSTTADVPRTVLDPVLDEIELGGALLFRAMDTLADYLQQDRALEQERRRPAPRPVKELSKVRNLMLAALVSHLQDPDRTADRPSEKRLCELITRHALRSGKGLHPKTLSKWLNGNGTNYGAEIDELLPRARRLKAIEFARDPAS